MPAASFRDLALQVAESVANGLANQDYPAVAYLGRVEPGYLAERTALDQVAFQMLRPENLDDRGFGAILLNEPGTRMQFGSLEVETLGVEGPGCLRELTIYQIEHDERFHLAIKCDADLFTEATTMAILADYQALLRACVDRPDASLAALATRMAPQLDVAADEG